MKNLVTNHDLDIMNAFGFARVLISESLPKEGEKLRRQITGGALPWEALDFARQFILHNRLTDLGSAWSEVQQRPEFQDILKQNEGVMGFPEEVKEFLGRFFPPGGRGVENG